MGEMGEPGNDNYIRVLQHHSFVKFPAQMHILYFYEILIKVTRYTRYTARPKFFHLCKIIRMTCANIHAVIHIRISKIVDFYCFKFLQVPQITHELHTHG